MEKKVRSWTVIQKLKDRFLPKKTVQNSKEPEEVRHERTPSIRLNVVDMLTDRTVTLDFPTSFQESDVLKLAFPSYNATGLIWEFRQGRLAIKDLRLADGDTLYVRIPDMELIRGNGLQELYFQSYTVSFRRLREEDDLIEIRCHGYDTKKTLEARLNSKVGKKGWKLKIREDSWPAYRTGPNGEREKIKYLCQLQCEEHCLMYVEEEPCAEEDTWQHPVCLYGCPAAKEFQGSDLLQSCSVEIVNYE